MMQAGLIFADLFPPLWYHNGLLPVTSLSAVAGFRCSFRSVHVNWVIQAVKMATQLDIKLKKVNKIYREGVSKGSSKSTRQKGETIVMGALFSIRIRQGRPC